MNLTRVRLRNFLSHPDTDWSPDGILSVLIGPKGAGKSAILDAVAYALFDSARAKTDDLVRRGQTQMSVVVEFLLDSGHYRVQRGRQTTGGGKTFLSLERPADDLGPERWEPVIQSSAIKDVQAAIDDLLRVDGDTFASAVLLMQGRVDAFARATAGERKAILAAILGLGVYDAARERARGAKVAADGDVKQQSELAARWADALAIMPDYAALIVELEESLALAEAKVVDIDRRIADQTLLVDAEKDTGANLPDMQSALGGLNRARADIMFRYQARADELRTSQDHAIRALEAGRAAGARAYAQARDTRAAIAAKYQALESEADTLERLIDEAKRVTCPECGAEFAPDQAHLQDRLDGLRAQVEALPPIPDLPPEPAYDQADADAIRAATADAIGEAAQENADELRRVDVQIAEMDKAIRLATDMMEARRLAEAARASLQGDRQAMQMAIASQQTRIADARARAEHRAKVQADHDAASYAREVALEEQRLYGELVQAFGPDGIPARIIEDVLPELEAAAQGVIDGLWPGASLSLEATRASKTSGAIEVLDVLVQDTEGQRDARMLSGGERTSVSLALSVSLARLIAHRAGASIRTLVVDEPDGLDIETRRAFGQMVRALAHQGDLDRVVLVSHHPDLAEFGDAVYAVSRDSRGSAISQQ